MRLVRQDMSGNVLVCVTEEDIHWYTDSTRTHKLQYCNTYSLPGDLQRSNLHKSGFCNIFLHVRSNI